jgi:glycosyltransferase involved in cell wall biosynthesis
VRGVSTHLNQLFASALSETYDLRHFQVGSEGRLETPVQKLLRLLLSPFQFAVFLIRYRPAIVHLNTSLMPKSYWRDLAYLVVVRVLLRKVVYEIHGGALPKDFFANNRWLTRFLHWVLMCPDVVVLLAQAELEAYRDFVPKQRLVVVSNAIDAGALTAEPLAAKSRDALQLVYLGRLAEEKGVFEILEAFNILIGQGRDMKLIIGGGGPVEVRLRAQVESLELSERVIFTGPVFGDEKNRLWSSSHIFVFPTHREGLPYALLEAMAAGAVPITTRVGGIPDVMQDGTHGLFVEPRDPAELVHAIARLDDDRDLLARMAEAGRKRVLDQFTVSRLAAEFRRIYVALIAEA